MKTINEQLDIVRKRIQDPKFLSGKGLSNEVNIHICCYDPKDEMIVRHFVGQITTDPSLNCHPIECDLFKIFLSICDDMEITDAIADMEEENGSEFMLEQLHSAIGEGEFIEKMDFVTKNPGDVLMHQSALLMVVNRENSFRFYYLFVAKYPILYEDISRCTNRAQPSRRLR